MGTSTKSRDVAVFTNDKGYYVDADISSLILGAPFKVSPNAVGLYDAPKWEMTNAARQMPVLRRLAEKAGMKVVFFNEVVKTHYEFLEAAEEPPRFVLAWDEKAETLTLEVHAASNHLNFFPAIVTGFVEKGAHVNVCELRETPTYSYAVLELPRIQTFNYPDIKNVILDVCPDASIETKTAERV